jgi:hypothetical protein
MKKFFILMVISSMFFSISSITFAASNEKKPEINYSADKGHNGKSYKQLVSDLENEGFSTKDADYYAKVDVLIADLERQGIKINLNEVSIKTYTNDEVKANPDEFRQKVLSLDKAALKTALSNHIEGLANGPKDLEKAFNSNEFQDALENGKPIGKKVTIKNPDGSTFTGSLIVKEDNKNVKTVEPNTYVQNGLWNQSQGFTNYSTPGEGNWQAVNNWTYSGSLGTVNTRDILYYSFSKHGNPTQSQFWTTSYNSDDGVASSTGSVNIDLLLPHNHKGESADSSHYIQSWTANRIKVSEALSLSSGILSISLSVNNTFYIYTVTEAKGTGGIYAWKAQYK